MGGDLRSIGESNQIARLVLKRPQLFKELIRAICLTNPLIRARASDAVEKITAEQPVLLRPYKKFILTKLAPIAQQEVRWHVAQLIPRLPLTVNERRRAFRMLLAWIRNSQEKSNIVKVFSMQAAFDLARGIPKLERRVVPVIKAMLQSKAPSLRSRARKMIKYF